MWGYRQDVAFRVLAAFLLTFIISRGYIYLTTYHTLIPFVFLNVNGVHVHHLTYGIILLALSGFLALTLPQTPRIRRGLSIVYGIGLALAYDEFGMWLHLKDDYWVRQSYDAVAVIVVLLVNAVYLRRFWRYMYHRAVVMTKRVLAGPRGRDDGGVAG